jgi:hypothetical protein
MVAQRAGCSQPKVSLQLLGRRGVTDDVADAVCSILGVDRDVAFPVGTVWSVGPLAGVRHRSSTATVMRRLVRVLGNGA